MVPPLGDEEVGGGRLFLIAGGDAVGATTDLIGLDTGSGDWRSTKVFTGSFIPFGAL